MLTNRTLRAVSLAGLLSACAANAGTYGTHQSSHAGIPPGHLPPPGECRIWYPDRPPGHQPPPGPCETLKYQVPPGARLVYGSGGSQSATTAAPQTSTSGGLFSKQTGGMLLGAAIGGLAGSQVGSGSGQLAATAGGALLGALIGNEIGRSMDEADRLKAEQAYTQAAEAPIGQKITWHNPESGNRGTITPVREGTTTSGRYCREYQQTVTIGGETQQAYGTACRQPDGSWQLVQG